MFRGARPTPEDPLGWVRVDSDEEPTVDAPDPALEALRFPIGPFRPVAPSEAGDRRGWRDAIADTPTDLRRAVEGLSDEQLSTPYRPGGWTVRQVVHHVPDSHMNAYIRFKLALTEDRPTIKPYDEAAWARLADGDHDDLETSLRLLELVHTRWIRVIDAVAPDEWSRELMHPEMGPLDLDALLQMYAWHGPHHVAHIVRLRERNAW